MRYWAYFVAKLAAAGAVLGGLLGLLNWQWPAERLVFREIPAHSSVVVFSDPLRYRLITTPARTITYDAPRFAYDLGYTFMVMILFLLAVGVVYLAWWDQRRRCRVCLHRLRMPVETGSWGRMLLFGRPRIEYICPYGHGTLKEEELQISGLENPEWTRHSDDIWEELCASSKDSGEPK